MLSKIYKVSNMSCNVCKKTVESKLKQSSDIKSATVNLSSGTVTIESANYWKVSDLQDLLGKESLYKIA